MRVPSLAMLVLTMLAITSLAPNLFAQQQKPPPCESAAVYKQFDFWVGDWDVFNPDGKQVGRNRIERIVGGCLLLENWSGGQGGSGKSINYYDPSVEKWKQHWVDTAGRIITVEGNLEDGAMRFHGDLVRADGTKVLYRMSFTPADNGSVHQFIETSQGHEQPWNVWFDGTYVRRGSGSESTKD